MSLCLLLIRFCVRFSGEAGKITFGDKWHRSFHGPYSLKHILRFVNYCKIAITSTQPTFLPEPEEELNKLLLMKVSDRERNVKVIMLVVLK